MATPDPLAGPVIPRADQDILNSIPGGTADYGSLDKTVRGLASVPGLTETILPSIKALLTPGADNPYIKSIEKSTSQGVASAQTEAMKRGLTGSDIEAGAMGMARETGEMAKSSFFADNAGNLAGIMKDLATGDINAQRENLMTFAQMMGQKITSEQDLLMFREMLAANMDQAEQNRDSAFQSALIGAGGSIAGGVLSGGLSKGGAFRST